VPAEHGGGGREHLEDKVQVLAGQSVNSVGHGHTLPSGGSMHPGPNAAKRGSANSQVPFL
jgi:hypothetical protein